MQAVGLDPADWPWETCVGDMGREGWEDVAKAGHAAIAAQQPQTAPDSRRALLDIIDTVDHLDEPGPEADHIRLLAEYGLGEGAHPEPHVCEPMTVQPANDVQPAPELAAAMRETAEVRDGYAKLCEEFSDSPQSGQSARISLTVLNRHRVRAGLSARRPTPMGERRDPFMEMREQLDAVRHFTETWAELFTGLPDSYTCTYTCAEANAAAELYQALGDERTAAEIIGAHAHYDEEGDEHHAATVTS